MGVCNTEKSKRKAVLNGRFFALPYAVYVSDAYKSLSPYGVKLLVDIGSQLNGKNNGDISMPWKLMSKCGWRSEDTLNKAKKELLKSGLIFEARKGRRPNLCSLYAVTWRPLNPLDIHDIGPNSFPYGAWANFKSQMSKKINTLTTAGVVESNHIATAGVVESFL